MKRKAMEVHRLARLSWKVLDHVREHHGEALVKLTARAIRATVADVKACVSHQSTLRVVVRETRQTLPGGYKVRRAWIVEAP